jgi:iron complex outermembrane receptor protein
MINISSRSRLVAAASPLAVAVVLAGAQPAWAQEAQPVLTGAASAAVAAQPAQPATGSDNSASPTPSDTDQTGIVVTGFRASLQNSINKKKRADQIVESVSAEDIGKSPACRASRLSGFRVALTSFRSAVSGPIIQPRF